MGALLRRQEAADGNTIELSLDNHPWIQRTHLWLKKASRKVHPQCQWEPSPTRRSCDCRRHRHCCEMQHRPCVSITAYKLSAPVYLAHTSTCFR